MSPEYRVRLTGFREINRALKILPDRLKTQALRAGVRAGAKEIRDIARAKVPVKTGRLRRSIKHQLRREWINEVVASVGWDYSIAKHGHLVEFGHAIVRKGERGNVIGHVPAHPYMRPALIAGRFRAIRAIRKKIQEWIYRRATRA